MLRLIIGLSLLIVLVSASSHSEAPGTARIPGQDVTDFYMFRSYESGRSGFTTLIANAYPLQSPFGGPNYYTLSDEVFFEINIDNDGDAEEDITFQFFAGSRLAGATEQVTDDPDEDDCTPMVETRTVHQGLTVNVGGEDVHVPLKFIQPVTATNTGGLNWFEWMHMNVIYGGRNNAQQACTVAGTTNDEFDIPFTYAGEKTFGTEEEYEAYANTFIHDVNLPGCGTNARLFAGPRSESFSVWLGAVFDLVNFNPTNVDNSDEHNDLRNLNIFTIALEVSTECLTSDNSDIIAGWLAVRKLDHLPNDVHAPGRQIGRLGHPLVNELVIGLKDKGVFNGAHPTGDSAVAIYVTNPTLPTLLDILFRDALGFEDNIAPSNFPRNDLVTTFLTGIEGLNQPENVVASEQLRLNTAIDPVGASSQNNMGVIAGDNAGFPNGRRPGDDVVDIALRVMMGRLCYISDLNLCVPEDAPVGDVDFRDGAPQNAEQFSSTFPYLNAPKPGARTNGDSVVCDAAASLSTSFVLVAFLALMALIW